MTGSSWRFVAANPGVDCWTAWSGRDATFLLIPVGRAASTDTPPAPGAGTPDPTRPGWRKRPRVPGAGERAVAPALQDGELHHGRVNEVRLEQWHNGRLVLIGDAAHATGPVWAQGVAMALEDALVLGSCWH